jgi:hypothetical protein
MLWRPASAVVACNINIKRYSGEKDYSANTVDHYRGNKLMTQRVVKQLKVLVADFFPKRVIIIDPQFYDGLAGGDFETAILENIKARAHFLVLLTPTALERSGDPEDWMRLKILHSWTKP